MEQQNRADSLSERTSEIVDSGNRLLEERAFEIFGLCKESFNNELSRHNALSTKATLYLALISLVFSALSIKMTDFIDAIKALRLYLYIFEVTLYFSSVILFSVAIWEIVKSIKIFDYEVYPENIFEQFENDSRIVILSSISRYLSESSKHNYDNNNKKSEYLKRALAFIQIGFVLLLLIFLSLIEIKIFGA